MLALHRAYRRVSEELRMVSTRLSEHPDLAKTRHQLVTLLTSLRSFSEILRDNPDLAPERRDQFTEVMVGESTRLAELVERHFEFITGDAPDGGLRQLGGVLTPAEEVGDLIQAQRNHFPPLERAAEVLARELALTPINSAERLIDALERRHGVSVEFRHPGGTARAVEPLRASRLGRWPCPRLSRPSSAVFRMASCLALLSGRGAIDQVCDQVTFGADESRTLCRQVLANYLAAALVMPYEAFLNAAGELRHDLDLIALRFGASFEQVCQRLTSLRRPGAEGVPFHFLRVDIAENLSKRFSASGLHIARHDGDLPALERPPRAPWAGPNRSPDHPPRRRQPLFHHCPDHRQAERRVWRTGPEGLRCARLRAILRAAAGLCRWPGNGQGRKRGPGRRPLPPVPVAGLSAPCLSRSVRLVFLQPAAGQAGAHSSGGHRGQVRTSCRRRAAYRGLSVLSDEARRLRRVRGARWRCRLAHDGQPDAGLGTARCHDAAPRRL